MVEPRARTTTATWLKSSGKAIKPGNRPRVRVMREPERCGAEVSASGEHPIIQSYEPGEEWWYCYLDDAAFLLDDAPSFSHP
jgi:hypothetical protein